MIERDNWFTILTSAIASVYNIFILSDIYATTIVHRFIFIIIIIWLVFTITEFINQNPSIYSNICVCA